VTDRQTNRQQNGIICDVAYKRIGPIRSSSSKALVSSSGTVFGNLDLTTCDLFHDST